MANAKAALEPAARFAGETVTAKHLPDGRQAPADVAPAAGGASIAATSVLAASTPRQAHASVNPGFGTAAPFICRNRGALPRRLTPPDSPVQRASWTMPACLRSCDLAVLPHNVRSRQRQAQGQQCQS